MSINSGRGTSSTIVRGPDRQAVQPSRMHLLPSSPMRTCRATREKAQTQCTNQAVEQKCFVILADFPRHPRQSKPVGHSGACTGPSRGLLSRSRWNLPSRSQEDGMAEWRRDAQKLRGRQLVVQLLGRLEVEVPRTATDNSQNPPYREAVHF